MEKLDKIWIWCIEYKRSRNMMCFRLEKTNFDSEYRFSAFSNLMKKWLPMTSHSGLAWGSSDDRNDVRLNFYIFRTGHVTNTVLDSYERLEPVAQSDVRKFPFLRYLSIGSLVQIPGRSKNRTLIYISHKWNEELAFSMLSSHWWALQKM